MSKLYNKWWILGAMTSSMSMIFLDISVLPVALPTIQKSISLSGIDLQWIVNAFTLALTLFMIASGKLGDRGGHRSIFLWGLGVFSLGSALCALSFSAWWFIGARFIQGIGGALLIPNAAWIVFHAFPANQRGKAMGLYVSVGSIFLSLGPLVGGFFSEYLNWRWIFWINPLIALVGLFLTIAKVPVDQGHKHPMDLIGFLLSFFGISLLIFPVMQSSLWGWSNPLTLALLLAGLLLLSLLFFHCKKGKEPYIQFSLFKKKNFSGALSCIASLQFLLMITVFWALYFQEVLQFTPVEAGTLVFLSNLPILVAAPLGGHLFDRFGPKKVISAGCLLIILSLIYFLSIMESASMGLLLTALIPFGIAIPLIFTPSISTAMGEAPPAHRGSASGLANMVRQFGGTLGLAVIGSIFLEFQASEAQKTGDLTSGITLGLKVGCVVAIVAAIVALVVTLFFITNRRLTETEN